MLIRACCNARRACTCMLICAHTFQIFISLARMYLHTNTRTYSRIGAKIHKFAFQSKCILPTCVSPQPSRSCPLPARPILKKYEYSAAVFDSEEHDRRDRMSYYIVLYHIILYYIMYVYVCYICEVPSRCVSLRGA